MPDPIIVTDIGIERARAYHNLSHALKEARDEATGLPITSIARLIKDSMYVEDIAALMNELGEYACEFNS